MIKVKVNGPKVKTEVEGRLADLVAETGVMLQSIYSGILEKDVECGWLYKKAITGLITHDLVMTEEIRRNKEG